MPGSTIRTDATRKGKKIGAIRNSGAEVITSILADDLTEAQALKLEAELIAAFGTEDTGGLLANVVLPSGGLSNAKRKLVIPKGVIEKSQIGLNLLKGAVYELAQANPDGISNADASKILGLQSDYAGGSKDYLSWSILGLLIKENKMVRAADKKHRAV